MIMSEIIYIIDILTFTLQQVDMRYCLQKKLNIWFQMLANVSGQLTAYHGDVLRFNMNDLFPEECVKEWTDLSPNIHIIGNLPFSVSLPLLFNYLKNISTQSDAWRYGRVKMTLTFQKEVAERMVAEAGHEQRCRVSILVQNYCNVRVKMVIPGKDL